MPVKLHPLVIVPSTLNHYPVIAAKPRDDEGTFWVLVMKPNHEYVVATWHERMGSEWHQGYYAFDFDNVARKWLEVGP